jgi:hypothetical protein
MRMSTRTGYGGIRRILLADWDPIGVGGESAAHDEYDSYAQHLHSMAANGASASELEAYLVRTELELMGLAPDHRRARRVAALLLRAAR